MAAFGPTFSLGGINGFSGGLQVPGGQPGGQPGGGALSPASPFPPTGSSNGSLQNFGLAPPFVGSGFGSGGGAISPSSPFPSGGLPGYVGSSASLISSAASPSVALSPAPPRSPTSLKIPLPPLDSSGVASVPTPARSPKKADSDADPAKVAECRKIYTTIDVDGDGAISMLELLDAMQRDQAVASFVLPGVDCSNIMHDEDSFDAVNAIFTSLARDKKRANLTDFTSHFCLCRASSNVANMEEMRIIFQRIDADSSGTISKLEFLEAVRKDPTVAAFVRPGLASGSVLNDEKCFDEVTAIFASVADGKKRASFADFVAHFRRHGAEVPMPLGGQIIRSQMRVFIIGTGFGAKLNPRQSQILAEAGFQLQFLHELPNPEVPAFPVMQYVGKIKAAIDEFNPHVVASASKGSPFLIALWQAGLWTGPSLMINAHPQCTQLPKNQRIVIAQGSNDEIYNGRSRGELEALIQTGSEGMCYLYYSADSGLLGNGGKSRIGDKHNMESILGYDCLPRLVDAALSHGESPELTMVRSWRERLTEQRLAAEAWLGYDPEQLRELWVSKCHKGRDEQKLFEVPAGSEEFEKVATVFKAPPKEAPAYGGCHPAVWAQTRILRIDRVENGPQNSGSARPYFESLQNSLNDQDVHFEPGVHTRWVFHGTSAVESIVNDPIAGFQPLAAGTKGASLWGSGTYFARDAKYVNDGSFCTPDRNGTRRMLMCLAMTGMPCLGDPHHKGVLPMRQGDHRYDSSVDSLASPEIFIVQHPSAAYPAYIITFA